MASPLETLNIILLHRNKNGKPDSLLPINGAMAPHMTTCINLARSALATEMGRQSCTILGTKFQEETQTPRWYGDKSMADVVNDCINDLITNWPPTIADESLSNPDNMGNTHRKGGFTKFDTREQPISINFG